MKNMTLVVGIFSMITYFMTSEGVTNFVKFLLYVLSRIYKMIG